MHADTAQSRASSASLDSERHAVDNHAHYKQGSPNLTVGGKGLLMERALDRHTKQKHESRAPPDLANGGQVGGNGLLME